MSPFKKVLNVRVAVKDYILLHIPHFGYFPFERDFLTLFMCLLYPPSSKYLLFSRQIKIA